MRWLSDNDRVALIFILANLAMVIISLTILALIPEAGPGL